MYWTKELKGPEAGDDDAEDGSGEEGVTFDLWKKTEVPPPRDPVLDEVLLYVSRRTVYQYHASRREKVERKGANLLPSNLELSSSRHGLLTR